MVGGPALRDAQLRSRACTLRISRPPVPSPGLAPYRSRSACVRLPARPCQVPTRSPAGRHPSERLRWLRPRVRGAGCAGAGRPLVPSGPARAGQRARARLPPQRTVDARPAAPQPPLGLGSARTPLETALPALATPRLRAHLAIAPTVRHSQGAARQQQQSTKVGCQRFRGGRSSRVLDTAGDVATPERQIAREGPRESRDG